MDIDHKKTEGEIKEKLEKIISIYFKEFLNKFDNFSNQLKVSEVLYKIYHYRYEKMKSKLSSINDIFAGNYEQQKQFFEKMEKLNTVEVKLTKVEIKLEEILKRMLSIEEKIENE